MPSKPTYPGVYTEEVSSGVRTITGVATSIALFVGWAARGPIDTAVRITSFGDYQRSFGPLDRRTWLGYSVKHFSDNGGAVAWVLRLVDAAAQPASLTVGDLAVEANSPGLWGDDYDIRITPHAAPDAARFRLEVLDRLHRGAVVERFEQLSMVESDPQFVVTAIHAGRSACIKVAAHGANAPAAAVTAALAGGADGAVLVPGTGDFQAALLAQFGPDSSTDRIDLFNLVCVPGEMDPATLAALQGDCRRRRAFLIADMPRGIPVATADDGLDVALTGPDGHHAAVFYPWVKAPDPLQQDAPTVFPSCGFVAGVFARTDSARGVWTAPAGGDASLNGVLGLELALSDAERGRINALGINCLRTLPFNGHVVWGARTMHGQNSRGSEWKYIPVRRMALFLEETLYRAMQWVMFEPNEEPLWSQIRLNIGAFLHSLFRQGAFQGSTPKEAYFVQCDRETTTQADIDRGIVNIVVGFAPLKPAEFVVLRLQQAARGIRS